MESTAGPSGLAPIFLAESGENAIVVVPGANAARPGFVDRHAGPIRSAGMVLCQLEIPMETISHTLQLCAEAGVPVMLDPARRQSCLKSLWSKLAWFTPTKPRPSFIWRINKTAEAAAQVPAASRPKGIVLKRGAEGSFVAVEGGKAAWVESAEVEAIDTVGAGDLLQRRLLPWPGLNGIITGPRPGLLPSQRPSPLRARRTGLHVPTRADIQEFLAKRS